MINKNEINIVTRVEHHLLCSCPCEECIKERQRRESRAPTNHLIKHLKSDAAFVLGFISHRNAHGSLARELMTKSDSNRTG